MTAWYKSSSLHPDFAFLVRVQRKHLRVRCYWGDYIIRNTSTQSLDEFDSFISDLLAQGYKLIPELEAVALLL